MNNFFCIDVGKSGGDKLKNSSESSVWILIDGVANLMADSMVELNMKRIEPRKSLWGKRKKADIWMSHTEKKGGYLEGLWITGINPGIQARIC